MIQGRSGFRFADREETYEAGEAYYVPAGHTPVYYAGTEIVEFSPTEILNETIPVVLKNLDANGIAAGPQVCLPVYACGSMFWLTRKRLLGS